MRRLPTPATCEQTWKRVVSTYNRLLKRKGRLIFEMMNELPRHPELSEVAAVPMNGIGKVAALLQRYQDEGELKGSKPWEATPSASRSRSGHQCLQEP